MSSIGDLLDLALKLPPAERACLAQQLLLSLEAEPPDEDRDFAWAVEIQARMARVEQGNFTAGDWREAVDRIRRTTKT